MPERSEADHEPKRIGLLGASFDTGNMGVSALAESSIKCILHKWPDAEVTLLASGREDGEHRLKMADKEILMHKLPIRFCKNVFLPNHFFVLALYAFLLRLLPLKRVKSYLKSHNSYLEHIVEMDLVIDITGGDSFSDIYGFRRFFLGFLCKWLVIFLQKKLVLLPQTYGPFKGNITRAMARYILNHADAIYSRDKAGVGYVSRLLQKSENGKVRFAPDVAFVLDSRKPDNFDTSPLSKIPKDLTLVGLNVSGLLFSGGYTRNNMFGLKMDYRTLVRDVIEMLLKDKNLAVLLVPHVFPPAGYEVESDPDACLKIYEQFKTKYPGRIFLVKGEYDQGEIKYIIGLSDFFIGSRMHACIAALSQGIPTIGLAYSKKFAGVFETVDVKQLVVDMRGAEVGEVLAVVEKAFEQRDVTTRRLEAVLPRAQQQILNVLEGIS